MTDDLDTRLTRAAAPDLDDESRDELLRRVRARVDAERSSAGPARPRRLRPRTRVALVAAAAAVLTAVPVVVSVVGQDGDGSPSALPAAIAVAPNGEFICSDGYATAVPPADAEVRLLPDVLPDGWGYTRIVVRHDRSQNCDAESLVALQLDATDVVTGRLAVTGPVDATINTPQLDENSSPDTVFGHPARRFDQQPDPTRSIAELHRWVWSDDTGRQWSAEVVGADLEEARRQLTGVAITGDAVGWQVVDPGWSLVHLRTGAPYQLPTGGDSWTVELTGGLEGRGYDVSTSPEPQLPAAAGAWIGDRLTEVAGHPAVISPVRGAEADGGPPGSAGSITLGVDVAPGAVAYSRFGAADLDGVERMLGSLRQVPPDDPRIQQYGED